MHWKCNTDVCKQHLPVCGTIVAVIWEEIIVKLPKDMKGDSSIGGRDIMIGFPKHGIKAVQGQVLAQ